MSEKVKTHPVQRSIHRPPYVVPTAVSMRAYEVYCRLYGEQPELVTGWCRGGFGTGELVAFLYARSFPEVDWRERFHEALSGMNL